MGRNRVMSCCVEFWYFIFCPCFGGQYEDDIEEARPRTGTSTYPISNYRQWESSNISPSHDYSPLFSSVSKSNASSPSSVASKPVLSYPSPSTYSDKFSKEISHPLVQTQNPKPTSSFTKSNASPTPSFSSSNIKFIKQISPPLVQTSKPNNSSVSNTFSRASVPCSPSTTKTETENSKSRLYASPSNDYTVARSNASSSSSDSFPNHLLTKLISSSFSDPLVTSPCSSPSNDSESPKKDQKGSIPRFEIPKHMQELIKNDIVPPVLKKPLSPSTYGEYFAALLYAEDFYNEKWSDYILKDVTLELRSKELRFQNQSGNRNNNQIQNSNNKRNNNQNQNSYNNRNKNKTTNSNAEKNESFVTFEIDAVPERRPYLLSRDHVLVRPAGKGEHFEPYQGFIHSVWRTRTVLADFQQDFHKQHKESNKYDVSFSFNRFCLKRAHRAVSAATNPLLLPILFPNSNANTYTNNQLGQMGLMGHILKHKGPSPYLIEGPIVDRYGNLMNMANTIIETIFEIYKNFNGSRVLICAPRNHTCDGFMRGIMKKVDNSDLFRANAAFREKEDVPDDILQASLFKGECFTCPTLHKLQNFRIITSTFISTYRLHNAGIKPGHFTHIFLVDASFCIEPEVIVSLTDLVSEDTVLVVTGEERNEPKYIRSDIGRRNGLKRSFFKRLLEREPYRSDDLMFVTHLG